MGETGVWLRLAPLVYRDENRVLNALSEMQNR